MFKYDSKEVRVDYPIMYVCISKGEEFVEQTYFGVLVSFDYFGFALSILVTCTQDELLQAYETGIIQVELFEKPVSP